MPKKASNRPHISTAETFWEDSEFTAEEAAVLRIKTKLHLELTKVIEQRTLIPKEEVGKILDMQQPNLSNLLNAKLNRMSVDRLTKYLHRLGGSVEVTTEKRRKLQSSEVA